MVLTYFPINASTTQYLIYTFVIPPYWGASNKSITITVPIGCILAGSSGGGTYTMTGIGATSATVLQNGASFPTTGFNLSNASAPTTKSFTITTANSAYSAYSYFNSYSFTFTPTQSSTTTNIYTCYLNIPNAFYNCSINSTASYVPSNYGIVINPVSLTNTFTNCVYLTGSTDTTGYLSYGYIINNGDFIPPATYNGYAVFDSIYCNHLINGLSYISVQDVSTTINQSVYASPRTATVYDTVLAVSGYFTASSLKIDKVIIPVDGNYFISSSNSVSCSASIQQIRYGVIKNGDGLSTGTLLAQCFGPTNNTGFLSSGHISCIVPLVKNDYINVVIVPGSSVYWKTLYPGALTLTIIKV